MEIATIQQIKVQLIAKNCAICTTDNALSTLPCDNVLSVHIVSIFLISLR